MICSSFRGNLFLLLLLFSLFQHSLLFPSHRSLEKPKPPCKYGDKCYRNNKEHLDKFSHPKDLIKQDEEEKGQEAGKKGEAAGKGGPAGKGGVKGEVAKKGQVLPKKTKQEPKGKEPEDSDEDMGGSEDGEATVVIGNLKALVCREGEGTGRERGEEEGTGWEEAVRV
jgi:hypothetical protein